MAVHVAACRTALLGWLSRPGSRPVVALSATDFCMSREPVHGRRRFDVMPMPDFQFAH